MSTEIQTTRPGQTFHQVPLRSRHFCGTQLWILSLDFTKSCCLPNCSPSLAVYHFLFGTLTFDNSTQYVALLHCPVVSECVLHIAPSILSRIKAQISKTVCQNGLAPHGPAAVLEGCPGTPNRLSCCPGTANGVSGWGVVTPHKTT